MKRCFSGGTPISTSSFFAIAMKNACHSERTIPRSSASLTVTSRVSSKPFCLVSARRIGRVSFSTSFSKQQFGSSGLKKNSKSAIVNSLSLIKPCLGEISFLKAWPICNTPKGSFSRAKAYKRLNSTNMPLGHEGLQEQFWGMGGQVSEKKEVANRCGELKVP